MTPTYLPALAAPGRTLRLLPWLALACCAAALGLVLVTTLRDPLKDDIAWLFYVAQQWMQGQRLYVDLVEVNPPLIVWMYAVPVRLAQVAGVGPKLVAMPLFAAIVLGCAWWAAGLIRSGAGLLLDRRITFSAIACVLLLIPGGEFGQREHLLAAMALPYLALVGSELSGVRVPRLQAVLIGVVAAVGCALKPRYLMAFGLVELLAVWQGVRLVRPVTLAAAATLALYGVAVLAFAPAFILHAVPLALAVYSRSDVALPDLLFDCRLLLFGVAAGFLLLATRRPERSQMLRLAVVFVFAAGATLVCIVEGKNWFYHRLPGTIAAVLGLLGLLLWVGVQAQAQGIRGWRARGPVLLAVLALLAFAQHTGERLRPQIRLAFDDDPTIYTKLAVLIRREKAHSYMAFSEWIGLGFPVINDTGVVWASRFDSMWPLHDSLRADGRLSPPLPGWPVAAWVAEDFVRTCPDVVVVDRGGPTNYVALLSRAQPAFRRAWALYRPIGVIDRLFVFRNRGSLAARRIAGCGSTEGVSPAAGVPVASR